MPCSLKNGQGLFPQQSHNPSTVLTIGKEEIKGVADIL